MSIDKIINYDDAFGELPNSIKEILSLISEKIGEQVTIQSTSEDCGGFGLETLSGEFVGEIYMGGFHTGYDTYPHIGIEIGQKFRRLGIGSKLYQIWEEFGNELLEEEFTRQIAKMRFLQELGYIPVSIINDETGREIEIEGEVDENKLGNGYSCRLIYEK